MRESKPNFDQIPESLLAKQDSLKFAVITAKWNSDFNLEMAESAISTLQDKLKISGEQIDSYEVPGAFEIPLVAKKLASKNAGRTYDAILVFATVIKGETIHFELVAQESTRGIMNVMLQTGTPVINGILACNTIEQAEARASRAKEDKGQELGLSAISMLQF